MNRGLTVGSAKRTSSKIRKEGKTIISRNHRKGKRQAVEVI